MSEDEKVVDDQDKAVGADAEKKDGSTDAKKHHHHFHHHHKQHTGLKQSQWSQDSVEPTP